MNEEAWSRLGKLLIARRVELGYPKRAPFAKAKGFKNDRVIAAIENAERQNFSPSTLAEIERAYEWMPMSIQVVLEGSEPGNLLGTYDRGTGEPLVFSQELRSQARKIRDRLVHGEDLSEADRKILQDYLAVSELSDLVDRIRGLTFEQRLLVSRFVDDLAQEPVRTDEEEIGAPIRLFPGSGKTGSVIRAVLDLAEAEIRDASPEERELAARHLRVPEFATAARDRDVHGDPIRSRGRQIRRDLDQLGEESQDPDDRS